jgi:hypothetical protein
MSCHSKGRYLSYLPDCFLLNDEFEWFSGRLSSFEMVGIAIGKARNHLANRYDGKSETADLASPEKG